MGTQHVVLRRSEPVPEPAILTAPRIAGAVSRVRNAAARARMHGGHVFGHDSEVMRQLDRRVSVLADAAHITDIARPLAVTLVLFDLANVGSAVARVHSLATWLLAVVQEVEAEDARAAESAADLAVIVASCELISSAIGGSTSVSVAA